MTVNTDDRLNEVMKENRRVSYCGEDAAERKVSHQAPGPF